MKINVKRGPANRWVINKWIIISIIIFAIVIAIFYFIDSSITASEQQQQFSALNFECASYGADLTHELAANSSACQFNENFSSSSNTTQVCGATFYCYYATSCAETPPVDPNTLSCLCDGLFSNRVAISGYCFKQS